MHQVQTARGPIDTAELGQTVMHEHVFVQNADIQQSYREEWGSEDERVAAAVTRLNSLAGQIEQMLVGNPRRYFENVDSC